MKKKFIGLFIIVFIFVAGVNIYQSKQRFSDDGIKLILKDQSETILTNKDFEKASPKEIEISITRKNGDVITNTYYAVDLSTVLQSNDYKTVEAVASDYFSATYTKEELPENVYLAFDQENETYEIIVAHDQFATRCVKDIQEIILT